METASGSFLDYWHMIMIAGAIIMVTVGIVIYLVHKLRLSAISSYKHKYDYINESEIKNYKRVFLCFAIAATMAINLYGMGKLKEIEVWFFVRAFMSIAGG